MKTAALIVAAGRGTRAGLSGPKQYAWLKDQMVLTRTISAFSSEGRISAIQVVIHPDDHDLYAEATEGLQDPRLLPPVTGGATRSTSVNAGLQALRAISPSHVLIHDAARPFLSRKILEDLFAAFAQDAEGVCPALPVVDALWRGGETLDTAHPREGLLRAQTPQGFVFQDILKAHQTAKEAAADDVEIARQLGLTVVTVPGSEDNFKITTPADFDRAKKRIAAMDVRTGCGYDVHAFEPGTHVTLCGIDIPHNSKLKGHSDADVAMHTITDALFGAIAEGDIGRWFPPSDPQWKGAASDIFLRKAVERIAARDGRISNIDCTIVCEFPKITPHADAMASQIAALCGIDRDRVSIKATTSERLGFTGREEGIAALATATVIL